MKCLKSVKLTSNPIYYFIIKKDSEAKPSKVAKIADLNKFLSMLILILYYTSNYIFLKSQEIYDHHHKSKIIFFY